MLITKSFLLAMALMVAAAISGCGEESVDATSESDVDVGQVVDDADNDASFAWAAHHYLESLSGYVKDLEAEASLSENARPSDVVYGQLQGDELLAYDKFRNLTKSLKSTPAAIDAINEARRLFKLTLGLWERTSGRARNPILQNRFAALGKAVERARASLGPAEAGSREGR